MGTNLEVVVGKYWLSVRSLYGIDSMSTVWPGGSDELQFTVDTTLARKFTGGEDVRVYFGGVRVWAGFLLEPDPSVDSLTAQGAYREGDGYPALDGSGNATKTPNTGIDQAIIRGLNWTRPTSISGSAMADADITQGPMTVTELLDKWADTNNTRWGIDPSRQVYTAIDPASPDYHTLPLAGGLGYTLENYASTLIGRYKTSTGFATVIVTDSTAESLHGHVEQVLDLTPRGVITSGQATTILNNILAKGKSTPHWTRPIEVVYGELLNPGGVPVKLETVRAGQKLRVNGGFEIVQRGNQQMYQDMVIGRTELSEGTLTMSPLLLAPRSFVDVLASVMGGDR